MHLKNDFDTVTDSDVESSLTLQSSSLSSLLVSKSLQSEPVNHNLPPQPCAKNSGISV